VLISGDQRTKAEYERRKGTLDSRSKVNEGEWMDVRRSGIRKLDPFLGVARNPKVASIRPWIALHLPPEANLNFLMLVECESIHPPCIACGYVE
jgi:hypothetical protein